LDLRAWIQDLRKYGSIEEYIEDITLDEFLRHRHDPLEARCYPCELVDEPAAKRLRFL